jgi:hypothetical protein
MCVQNTNTFFRKVFVENNCLDVIIKYSKSSNKKISEKANEILIEWDKEFGNQIPEFSLKNQTKKKTEKIEKEIVKEIKQNSPEEKLFQDLLLVKKNMEQMVKIVDTTKNHRELSEVKIFLK